MIENRYKKIYFEILKSIFLCLQDKIIRWIQKQLKIYGNIYDHKVTHFKEICTMDQRGTVYLNSAFLYWISIICLSPIPTETCSFPTVYISVNGITAVFFKDRNLGVISDFLFIPSYQIHHYFLIISWIHQLFFFSMPRPWFRAPLTFFPPFLFY